MSCHHTRAVLDGQAPHVDVSPHLHGCPDCRAYVDELDAIDADVAALLPAAPSADLIASTLDAVEAAMDADESWDFDQLFVELAQLFFELSQSWWFTQANPIETSSGKPFRKRCGISN